VSEPVRVIVCRVDKETGIAQPPTVEELPVDPDRDGHLAAMQKIVGGLVECVGGFDGRGTDLWCNEEGLLLGLPMNRIIAAPPVPEPPEGFTVIYADAFDEDGGRLARPGEPGEWRIRGDFFIARVDEEGGIASVTDEDVAYYTDLFKETP
jgi:hypothetical protein